MGRKKFSSFIDITNNIMISNTGPDGNRLPFKEQYRGGFAEMLLDTQSLGQWQAKGGWVPW